MQTYKTAGRYMDPHAARWVTLHVPEDPDLADLLKGSGRRGALNERLVHTVFLAAHVDSGNGNQARTFGDDLEQTRTTRTIRFLDSDAALVGADLTRLLASARAEGHPGADALEQLAGQLSVNRGLAIGQGPQ